MEATATAGTSPLPGDVDPCPLCGAREVQQVWEVAYEQIWRQLETQWDVRVPSNLRAPWDAAGSARLGVCTCCGLEYFCPLLPGSGDFYSLVSSFYVDNRWEFGKVAARLRQDDRILDLGCGRGAFLRSVRSQVAQVVGCDFNPDALTGETPFEVLPAPFLEAAAARPGAFSVAVSFHVLEHVRDVREILDAARTALQPGGRMFLSTPDRERTSRSDFEVFDCPPHHLSRWSGAQFAALAEAHGWELVRVDHEPFVHRTGHRRLVPKPALYAAGVLKHALRGGVQRPRGLRIGVAADQWPRGLAVLAEFRLPRGA